VQTNHRARARFMASYFVARRLLKVIGVQGNKYLGQLNGSSKTLS
jgi:hypothetical protein